MSQDARTRRLTRPSSATERSQGAGLAPPALVSLLAHTTRLVDLLPSLHQHALDVTGGSRLLLFEHNLRNGVLQATSGFGLDAFPSEPWTPAPHEAAIVNPDRRAIGAEQTLGPVAEAVESGGELQVCRQALRKFVEKKAQIALQLIALPQAGQLKCQQEGVGQRRDVVSKRRRRRAAEANGDHPDAIVAAAERQKKRRSRAQPGRQVGHVSVRVRHD